MLPQYLDELLKSYQKGFPETYNHLYSQIEEMVCWENRLDKTCNK